MNASRHLAIALSGRIISFCLHGVNYFARFSFQVKPSMISRNWESPTRTFNVKWLRSGIALWVQLARKRSHFMALDCAIAESFIDSAGDHLLQNIPKRLIEHHFLTRWSTKRTENPPLLVTITWSVFTMKSLFTLFLYNGAAESNNMWL